MMMNKVIIAFLSLVWINSVFAAQNQLFSAEPAFNKLPNSILELLNFQAAPNPKIKHLQYISHTTTDQQHYSNYRIDLVTTADHLTQYQTQEVTGNDQLLRGKGIGYGGIFSMQYLKQGDLVNKKDYYMRYQWLKISNVQGHLFPLKVGNKISFNYEEAYKTSANGWITTHKGKIQYQVIDEIDDYNTGYVHIPGKTFVILFSKSDSPWSSLHKMNLYHFSQQLGWYVTADYFFSDKKLVGYKLRKYS